MNLYGFSLLAQLTADARHLAPKARAQAAINRIGALRNAQRQRITSARKVERDLAAAESHHSTKGRR
jgi:hypothetical protein